MNGTLKMTLLKKLDLMRIVSSDFYEFDDGIAIVINRQILCWFNIKGELVFKFYPTMHFIKETEIVGVVKVNNWLKLYFIDNMVLEVLADNTGYLMKNGSYLYHYYEEWHPMLLNAKINNNILFQNGRSITFKYPIDNIQYYDEGFIVLANSKEQFCDEQWLTLYSVSDECKLRWQIADYTKIDPIPEDSAFELYNDRIETFTIKGDLIYANTFGAIRLAIDAKTGKTVSYSSFAWRK